MCIFHNLLSEDDLRLVHTYSRLFVDIFMSKIAAIGPVKRDSEIDFRIST
jgi:hypothetical protein